MFRKCVFILLKYTWNDGIISDIYSKYIDLKIFILKVRLTQK